MLDSLKKRPGSLRWPPRQRFTATDQGREALVRYQEGIQRYRERGGDRDALERVQQEWASGFHVEVADATVLEEFAGGRRLPREVQVALDDCGTTLSEVQAAIDRLYIAGLLAPITRDGEVGGGPLSTPTSSEG